MSESFEIVERRPSWPSILLITFLLVFGCVGLMLCSGGGSGGSPRYMDETGNPPSDVPKHRFD
ncbi:MAG: hypothetical protein ACTS27_06630 [Phycisphaerales bacterium]